MCPLNSFVCCILFCISLSLNLFTLSLFFCTGQLISLGSFTGCRMSRRVLRLARAAKGKVDYRETSSDFNSDPEIGRVESEEDDLEYKPCRNIISGKGR